MQTTEKHARNYNMETVAVEVQCIIFYCNDGPVEVNWGKTEKERGTSIERAARFLQFFKVDTYVKVNGAVCVCWR